jgi:DNA-binding NarL/FixJ family response regulator
MQQPVERRRNTAPPSAVPPVTALTPREREVAALIAEGLSNAEIAQRLVLSPGTVGNHVGHILRALGARNRVQVAVWAVEQGLRSAGPAPGDSSERGPFRAGRAADSATDAG